MLERELVDIDEASVSVGKLTVGDELRRDLRRHGMEHVEFDSFLTDRGLEDRLLAGAVDRDERLVEFQVDAVFLDIFHEGGDIFLDPEQYASGIAELDIDIRSEEHTSELQSLMRHSYAVFCLKKKKKKNNNKGTDAT